MQAQTLSFPPFRLDLANEQLWRAEQLTALRPKTFAILCATCQTLGLVHVWKKQYEQAIAEAERAVALDPGEYSVLCRAGGERH